MDSNDYLSIVMENINKYYTHNTGSLSTNSFVDTNSADLFTSQSIVDMFNDISIELGGTVDNHSTKKETIKFTISDYIGDGSRLVKEFGYTDMQVQITHNKHFEKIQSLLTEFNSLTCNKESDKVLSNIYSEHLIRFLSSFKLNQQAILTKHGMQYCNDIYNWYEGIKGYINTGGAKRT